LPLMPLSVEHSTPQQNKVLPLLVKLLLPILRRRMLLLLMTLPTKSMTLTQPTMVAG
jgi:hypothetical protein